MPEISRRSGAVKKQAVEVILLADGKTPANENALKRALEKYGAPVLLSLEEKLASVREHLDKAIADFEHTCDASCDSQDSKCPKVVCGCGEVSTYKTDFCPFCGDTGLPPDSAADVADASLEAAPPAPEENALGVVEEAPEAGSAVEVLPPAPDASALVANLDTSVDSIKRLKEDLTANTFDLGVELARVNRDELWKARVDGNGALLYKNFGAWVEAETEIGRSLAFDLIKVTESFDRQTFLEVGSTKLRLIAGIEDPQARAKALDDARAGASTRELERTHTTRESARRAAPAPAPERTAQREAPAPEKPKGREAPKKGTEILLLAKVDGKAKTHPFTSAKTGRTVKQYGEDAFVEVRISEQVVQHIAPKFGDDGKTLVGFTVAFYEEPEAA